MGMTRISPVKPKPLSIAIGAAVLLVVVLAADISMNRSYGVDLRDAEGEWVTVTESRLFESRARPYGAFASSIDPNGTVEMRIRVDNGYAWAFDKEYVVYANANEIARGTLEVPARSSGTATFTVPGKAFFGAGPDFPKSEGTHYVQIELVVAGEHLYGSVNVKEASS